MSLGIVAAAQDAVPDHPDKLKFPPLTFQMPDPAAMRAALPGGMVVYAVEDPSLPLVKIDVLVRTGSFWQPKGREGLASLCATVMRTGGTKKRDPKQVDEEVEMLAAELGVSIGDTSGTASLTVLSKDLDAGLDILFDVLRDPAFRQEKLDLAKDQSMQSMKSRNDSTRSIEARETSLHLYGDHPVNAHPTKASIDSITRDDLVAFHRESFVPANFVVAASGSFRKAELLKKLEKACEGWESGPFRAREVPPATHQAAPGVRCFHKEGKNINQGRVTIEHLGIDLRHPDVHALRVMAYILGAGGFSSRLVQRVRTDEGLAYDVGCGYSPGLRFAGVFEMSHQSKSESCLFATKLCLEELERIRTKEVEPQELKDAIGFYLDAFPGLFFSDRHRGAVTFANAELHGYPKNYFQTWREKVGAVTAADVLRVAKERCRPEKLVFTFVGNIDDIAKGDGKHPVKLEDFGPVTRVPLPDPLTLERPKR